MDELLIKYLLKETNGAENKQVEAWLAENDQHRQQYARLSGIWKLTKDSAKPVHINNNLALQQLKQKMKGNEHRHTIVMRWRVAAAVIAVALCITGITYLFTRTHADILPIKQVSDAPTKDQVATNNIINAPLLIVRTGTKTLSQQLPDGSIAILNKHSAISYSDSLPGKRNLVLDGEAFFSVVHNQHKPFTVKINEVTITDIGTSFNARSYNGAVEIEVETGIVKVKRGQDSILVNAGEQLLIIKNKRFKKQRSADKLYAYYLDRPMVCKGVTLARLVATLNKKYDANITIGRGELADLSITTIFYKQTLAQVLDIISQTLDLKIEHRGPSIVLE